MTDRDKADDTLLWFWHGAREGWQSWVGYPGIVATAVLGGVTYALGGEIATAGFLGLVAAVCMFAAVLGIRVNWLPKTALFAGFFAVLTLGVGIRGIVLENQALREQVDEVKQRRLLDASLSGLYRRGEALRTRYQFDPESTASTRTEIREWHDSVRSVIETRLGGKAIIDFDRCLNEQDWHKWNSGAQVGTVLDCLHDAMGRPSGAMLQSAPSGVEFLRAANERAESTQAARGDAETERRLTIGTDLDRFLGEGISLRDSLLDYSTGHRISLDRAERTLSAWKARVASWAAATLGPPQPTLWGDVKPDRMYQGGSNTGYEAEAMASEIDNRREMLVDWSKRFGP